MTTGYFLIPAFLTNQIHQENQVMSLKPSAFFTSEASGVFSVTFITPQQRLYNPNGRAVWGKVCTSLLPAVLLGKINYKACSSYTLWILKLSQKQFPPRGDHREVKRLPISQTDITGKGQKTGKYCDMNPFAERFFQLYPCQIA